MSLEVGHTGKLSGIQRNLPGLDFLLLGKKQVRAIVL